MMKDAAGPLPGRLSVIDDGRALFRAVADFPKPLVVALEGDTYGIGATVAMMGDALVSHPTVKIADTHVVMGLTAGDGGLVAWPMTVGMVSLGTEDLQEAVAAFLERREAEWKGQ